MRTLLLAAAAACTAVSTNMDFFSGYIVEYGGLGGGVPEPSAWALLILGFGTVGGALRRSRKVRAPLTYA